MTLRNRQSSSDTLPIIFPGDPPGDIVRPLPPALHNQPPTLVAMFTALAAHHTARGKDRQADVMLHFLHDTKDRDIAAALDIKYATHRTHVNRMFKAFGVRTRAGITRIVADYMLRILWQQCVAAAQTIRITERATTTRRHTTPRTTTRGSITINPDTGDITWHKHNRKTTYTISWQEFDKVMKEVGRKG